LATTDVPLISQRVHHNNTKTLPGRVVRGISVHHNLGFSRLAQVPPEGWKVQTDDSYLQEEVARNRVTGTVSFHSEIRGVGCQREQPDPTQIAK